MAGFIRIFILSATLFSVACVSRHEVADDYRLALAREPKIATERTVIFFLIDGLPAKMLEQQLAQGHLPGLQAYFLKGNPIVAYARTVFPSLTFPAIASLLSEEPVDKHGIYSNETVQGSETLNFEDVSSYPSLNARLKSRTIFTRLHAKGLRSVSFDYAFQAGADAHTNALDLDAALAVSDKNYKYVDLKTMASLNLLLKKTASSAWPDFIFVHLIGLDLITHDKGPENSAVEEYLQDLDAGLTKVFATLNKAEQRGSRQVVALLSSDHGFDDKITRHLKLSEAIHEAAAEVQIINQGRYLELYFPKRWSEAKRLELLQSVSAKPDVDLVALRSRSTLRIQSHTQTAEVYFNETMVCDSSNFAVSYRLLEPAPLLASNPRWDCPEKLSEPAASAFYPYFVANVSRYFSAASHPDAVILGQPGVTFKGGLLGQHGGPTPQELFVPLLLHNALIDSKGPPPAIWQLLNFMSPFSSP